MPKGVGDWSSEAAPTHDGGQDLREVLAHYVRAGRTEKRMRFGSSDYPSEMQSVGGARQFGGGFMYCQATAPPPPFGAPPQRAEPSPGALEAMRLFPLPSVTPSTGMRSIYFTFNSCEFVFKKTADVFSNTNSNSNSRPNISAYELTFKLQGCFVWDPDGDVFGPLSEANLEDTELLVTYRGTHELAQQTLRVGVPGAPDPLFESDGIGEVDAGSGRPKDKTSTFIFTGAQTLITDT